MNKLGTAVGGLLLIGALAAPVAFAHYDSGFGPLGAALNAPSPTNNENRVAGWYYGSTNTYTELDSAFAQPIPGNPSQFCTAPPLVDLDQPPNGVQDEIDACLALTSPVNPGFLFAQWSGLGDVEVGGTGDCTGPLAATAALNEETVDGVDGLGSVPDGTWHDGGHGYITHTDHYACEDWNTLGCDYAPAVGADLTGTDLWLATQCNWGIPTDNGQSPGLVDIVLEFLGDVINCPLGGFPTSCLEAVDYLGDCLGLVDLIPALDQCQGGNPGIVCGNGSIGTTNFGSVSGHEDGTPGVDFPTGGLSDPGGATCDADDRVTASVFPFTALVVNLSAGGTPSVGHASVATVGWVG